MKTHINAGMAQITDDEKGQQGSEVKDALHNDQREVRKEAYAPKRAVPRSTKDECHWSLTRTWSHVRECDRSRIQRLE